MAKSVQLLLTENVESLGIVGDVVSVKLGYARNYLLPFGLATEPSEEKIAELAAKRATAEKEMADLRSQREKIIETLENYEITLQRSCNDQGVLYGSVTQQDISSALESLGHGVPPRNVRLMEAIKRVDTYDVTIRFDADLETTIKVWVVPDRELDIEEREEMEFDNEGNLIEKPRREKKRDEKAEAPAEA